MPPPIPLVAAIRRFSVNVGDLVRYTPEGKVVEQWADWYGLVVREDLDHPNLFAIVRWNKDNNNTISIRKKDLTVVNESR